MSLGGREYDEPEPQPRVIKITTCAECKLKWFTDYNTDFCEFCILTEEGVRDNLSTANIDEDTGRHVNCPFDKEPTGRILFILEKENK